MKKKQRLDESNASQKTRIVDFALSTITGGESKTVSFLNIGSDSISVLKSFFSLLDVGYSLPSFSSALLRFKNYPEPKSFFSSENDLALNGISTYLRNQPEVVTNYYEEKRKEIVEMLGGLEND